jgi:hypothetical protein
MTDTTMVQTFLTCRQIYDTGDPKARAYHQDSVDFARSRCHTKPSCYVYGPSFCFCPAH